MKSNTSKSNNPTPYTIKAMELIAELVPIDAKDKDYVKLNKLETRKSALQQLERLVLDRVIGGNDIVEFGDPLLSPTWASQDARSRDKLRAEQRAIITNGKE